MNEKINENIYIYDLETYPNFFLATFYNIITEKYYEFEISDRKTEIKDLYSFLNNKKLRLVGFNNINFDYPVLHNSILSRKRYWTAEEIYKITETILSKKYSAIRDKYIKIPQLDLYKIWHYDNKNKSTSLKWLEFAMRMHNVEDLPFKPGTILNDDQKDIVLKYCRNDIKATKKFYDISSKHIELRKFYTKFESMNLMNASEITMSKEIFSKHLAKEMNISQWDVKQLRTERKKIDIKDIIFDYIKFNDPINQKALDIYNSYKWIDTSDMTKKQKEEHSIKFTIPYKNVKREYAEGGLHSFGKPGIYKTEGNYMLVDVDFKRSRQ